MPTTTNYGWDIPADTDLVKNGALAIRTLGNSADTTVKSVADGRGLVHINTTTFSGVSSQSVSSVFSSTYDNYRIIFSNLDGSTSAAIQLRLGTTSTGYYYNFISAAYSSTSATNVSNGNNASVFDTSAVSTSTTKSGCVIDIYNPNLAATSAFSSFGIDPRTTGGGARMSTGYLNDTTQYTGFLILPSTGTISGTVSTYGYRK